MYPPSGPSRGGFARHVTQQGIGRGACFFGVPDRRAYLALLVRAAPAFECRVHAYVLMGNHVHLLLTPAGTGGAAGLLQAVRDAYRPVRTGIEPDGVPGLGAGICLEAGRTVALVHTARHLLACMRYIELNPVRAGLVRRPEDFRWSSYGANADGRVDPLLSPHPHYLALARDPERRRAAYRESVEALLHRGRQGGTEQRKTST